METRIYNEEGKELITLKEAQRLGFARAEALKMRILVGKLKGIKKGRDWLIVKEDVYKESEN